MKEYQGHEFCKDINCPTFNKKCHETYCHYSAKEFLKWLKQNNYQMFKPDHKIESDNSCFTPFNFSSRENKECACCERTVFVVQTDICDHCHVLKMQIKNNFKIAQKIIKEIKDARR